MYLYTKADDLIPWTAVESHAQEAASMQGLSEPLQIADIRANTGGPVVAWRRWEKANHCDLIRADQSGYLTAIRTFLEGVL